MRTSESWNENWRACCKESLVCRCPGKNKPWKVSTTSNLAISDLDAGRFLSVSAAPSFPFEVKFRSLGSGLCLLSVRVLPLCRRDWGTSQTSHDPKRGNTKTLHKGWLLPWCISHYLPKKTLFTMCLSLSRCVTFPVSAVTSRVLFILLLHCWVLLIAHLCKIGN